MSDSPIEHRRAIRSYVLRQGRMSVAQKRAHDTLSERYVLPYAPQLVDLDTLFGRRAPQVLEIGFGMGETTAAIAQAQPDHDFVGIEVHAPGVGALLKRIEQSGLTNVRVIRHDAVEVVAHMIPPASLAGIHVYFPDPWPKRKHHRRRMIQDRFLEDCTRVLVEGGELRVATDHPEYWAWMEEHFSRWTTPASPFERCPFEKPAGAKEGELVGTNFERKYIEAGRIIRRYANPGAGASTLNVSNMFDLEPDAAHIVRAEIDEASIPLVAVGQAVDVTSEADAGMHSSGQVLRIARAFGERKLKSDAAQEATDERVVEVVVSAGDAPYLIGQRVMVKFRKPAAPR